MHGRCVHDGRGFLLGLPTSNGCVCAQTKQVLEAASTHSEYGFSEADALVLHERCTDVVSTVRRQAMSSLTTLMNRFPENFTLQGYGMGCMTLVSAGVERAPIETSLHARLILRYADFSQHTMG